MHKQQRESAGEAAFDRGGFTANVLTVMLFQHCDFFFFIEPPKSDLRHNVKKLTPSISWWKKISFGSCSWQ